MRYYCYIEPIFDKDNNIIGDDIKTVSTKEIEESYYPYWKQRMINKYGEEKFQRDFCFLDCLDDWIAVNWAWAVEDNEEGQFDEY